MYFSYGQIKSIPKQGDNPKYEIKQKYNSDKIQKLKTAKAMEIRRKKIRGRK